MYEIKTFVFDKILESHGINNSNDYTIEKMDILENGDYYTQGFTECDKRGTYCDDYLYIYGILNSEMIVCGASIRDDDEKPVFAVEVIFEGIGKEREERKIYIKAQSSKKIETYRINCDEYFQLVFEDIKPRYGKLPKNFDDEYNRLMGLLIPQLQACREYLMLIGNRTLNKVTDFKK